MEMQEGQTSQATDEDQEQEERMIDQALQSKNIAESLSKEQLTTIGADCHYHFECDLESRKEWENNIDDWLKLAMQTREQKSFPWNKASNVKYPLISTAAMQFAARAYPSLVPSDGKVVKGIVIGSDPDGKKQERADRIATYMSYQILHEMNDWEEDMDKMLMMLPIVGTVFKKTFYSKATNKVS